jgi:predicted Zn-dependent peptidase
MNNVEKEGATLKRLEILRKFEDVRSSAPSSAIPFQGKDPANGFAKSTLENGLRIVTESIPGARSVSIGVVVECGSRDEHPDEAGLAHLCEHMVFQGTCNRNARELSRDMDAIGGEISAFTTRDYTCYYATVQDEYSFHALDLLGDILLNPTFPEEELEREKNCISREIESGIDHPMRRAQDLLLASIWPGHALGRPVAGEIDHVRRHTRDDAIYFYHRHYVPERMIIAAAGNLDHEDFVAQTRDVFWRLLGEEPLNPAQRPVFASGLRCETSASHQSYMSLAIDHSRLFQQLRENSGLVYDVSSQYIAYRDAGLLRIELATEPSEQRAALQAVVETIADLATWKKPIDDAELWRAKLQLRSQYLIASEMVHTRMSRLASQETYFGTPFQAEAIPDAIGKVDLKTLRRLATGKLLPSFANLAAVVVSPSNVSDLLEPGAFPAFVATGISNRRRRPSPPRPRASARVSGLKALRKETTAYAN